MTLLPTPCECMDGASRAASESCRSYLEASGAGASPAKNFSEAELRQ